RLLNPGYPGGEFAVPDQLFQDLDGDPTGNTWSWSYRTVDVTPGDERVEATEIDYNGPAAPDPLLCVANTEVVPPEGTQLCGFDPGEPSYAGFGVLDRQGYSTPSITAVSAPGDFVPATARLFDPTRGRIAPRNPNNGNGGLRKPSLRVPVAGGRPNRPNFLINSDPNNTIPSNENDFVRD